jgi:hypothetical protein
MKKFKKTIADFESHNPLPIFFEHGYTPDSIKKEIIASFSEFFENKANLSVHAIDGLATTWVAYLTSLKIKGFKTRLKEFSSFSKSAFSKNESLALAAYFDWADLLTEATNKYWSVKNLSQDTDLLCLEDMVEATFQTLGQLIEGLIKPYIKFYYQLFSITSGSPVGKSALDSFDLGKTVKSLSELSNTILINPLNVSLNQWRNIAYHHNYIVEADKIVCSYGSPNNPKKIILSRKKLKDVVISIYSFYKILKVEETILIYDNLQKIQRSLPNRDIPIVPLRDESHLISLYSSISTQGFLVKDLVINNEKTSLTVQELLDEDPLERGIHSSQFLHVIWGFSKTKIIEVIYKKNDESTYLISTITNKTLEKFDEGKLQMTDLVKQTNFNFVGDPTIKSNISSLNKLKENFGKKDPFNVHLLTAIPTNEKYHSQLGKQISVKEFIKDFSLATFSNYLIFRELGYSSNNIKINVGKEGSMVILEDTKRLLSNVPAIIKEKFVQQLIMVCVGEIITLFEKSQLVDDLIAEAKQRPNFNTNLSLIQNYLAGVST